MAEHTIRAYDGRDGCYLHVDDVCRMMRELAEVAENTPMGVLYQPLLAKLADTFAGYSTATDKPVPEPPDKPRTEAS